ncbi:MAG TPA: hypothetical protein VM580_15980 [Labilithrix sp.]|jgi:hypothetical protein|nr:hypothetical protein [Labilithrix sp.]
MQFTLTLAARIALVGLGFCAVGACVGVDPDPVSTETASSDKTPSDTAAGLPDAGATDVGPSSVGDGGAHGNDAACSPVAGNLLDNPSFELGGAAWFVSSSAVASTDGPADCAKYLEVDFPESWDSVRQYLDLSFAIANDGGAQADKLALDFGVSIKSLDDVAEPALIGILNDDSGSDAAFIRSKSLPPNQWVTVSGTVLVTPRSNFYFFVGNEDHRRKLGVDRAWVAIHH